MRYQTALNWSLHPTQIPSLVWLPMHFWLLGLALELSRSEWSARLVSIVFGVLTILPFWGIVSRLFDFRVALYSALSFAVLGIHVGYSVVSSSEASTLFFLVFGVYSWVRYRLSDGQWWAVLCGLALSTACLCRYEPWVAVVTIIVLTLPDVDSGRLTDRRWFPRVALFLLASAGAIGWCVFSYREWHDPFFSAHQTILLNQGDINKGGGLYRFVVVPGAIVASLGPLAFLSLLGIAGTITQPRSLKGSLSVLVAVLLLTHWANSVAHYVTLARYILMYIWLLIPFAFEGMRSSVGRQFFKWSRNGLVILFIVFLFWQLGVTAVGQFGPCSMDRLGTVSPILPFRCGLRHMIAWIDNHPINGRSIILDNVDYEPSEIVRFAHLEPSAVFIVPAGPVNLESLAQFVKQQHPQLLIYTPRGHLGRMLPLPDSGEAVLETTQLDLRLHRLWSAGPADYRIYEVVPISIRPSGAMSMNSKPVPKVNEYYVSPSGNDGTGNGSQHRPWKTLCKADASAQLGPNGTIIHIGVGQYTDDQQGRCWNSSAGIMMTTQNGTATQRIIWHSDTLYGAQFNGEWLVDSNYVDITGFEFNGSVKDVTGLIIGCCGGADNPNVGNFVHVYKNRFENLAKGCHPSGTGPAAVQLNTRSHDFLFDSNVVNNVGHWAGGCSGSINAGAHGVYIAGWRATVTNNLISGAAAYGIHAYHNSCQQNISNNTVVHNYVGGILLSAGPESGESCNGAADYSTVNNNLVIRNGFGCGVKAPPGQGGIPDGIVLYNTGSIPHTKVSNNYLAGNFSSGCSDQNNNRILLRCDPRGCGALDPFLSGNIERNGSDTSGLVKNYNDDVTLGDYHPVPGSPLIGAGSAGNCTVSPGISSCIPALDFDGVSRQGSTIDIGAHQFLRRCVTCK